MTKKMNQHTLDVLLGPRVPNDMSLTKKISPVDLEEIAGGVVFAGRIVHQDDVGNWTLGVGDQTLPWVLYNSSNDLDVINDGGDPTQEADAWAPGTPTKIAKAICVIQGSMFESTEFAKERTYVNNQPLTALPLQGDAEDSLEKAGVLTNLNVTFYGDCVVGIVAENRNSSSAKNRNTLRDTLKWIGYFLPKSI